MFRSEEMAFCEMLLPCESAYEIIAELGEFGQTQFVDLNKDATPLARKYGANFKQCGDLERILGDLEVSISKENIKLAQVMVSPPVPDIVDLSNLQATLQEVTVKLKESAKNIDNLKEQERNLVYMINVIDLTQNYTLSELLAGDETQQEAVTAPDLGNPSPSLSPKSPAVAAKIAAQRRNRTSSMSAAQVAHVSAILDSLMGVIDRKMSKSFEKILFRIGRGNIFVRTMPIDDAAFEQMADKTNDRKSVFIAYFNSQALKEKITQICQAFHAIFYEDTPNKRERIESRRNMCIRLEDVKSVLNQAVDQRQMLLTAVAQQVKTWFAQVHKAKAVLSVMGMLNWDVTRNYTVAECWCVNAKMPEVEATVRRASTQHHQRNRSQVIDDDDHAAPAIVERKAIPPGVKMPTHFRLNKLTSAYQNIVNAYAVPLPGEVNPSLFTVITFPFLYSVMYGDLGHAVILTVFGLWMIVKEKSLKKVFDNYESIRMIFGGRYMILLMGLFSLYAGIIYNDMFCKSFRIFKSSWYSNFTNEQIRKHQLFYLDPVLGRNRLDPWPYPIGLDPIWDFATNRLMEQNSVKMKLSVIFGVSHMLFGICLSLINHIHFGSRIDIFCNFLPQILFIVCLFVYMDALIIFKWIYFDATKNDQAFSVLIEMINMILFKYTEETPSDKFISQNLMTLQMVLVITALITVPWMLLVKPLYLRRQHQIAQEVKKKLKRENEEKSSTNSIPQAAPAVELQEVTVVVEAEQRRESYATSSIHPATLSTIDESFGSVDDDAPKKKNKEESDEEDQFQFSEVFIHQAIHTIEYVLGLISHTASYLRLWALNLAHSELATVLWHMVLRIAFSNAHDGYTGIVALVIIFIPWSVLSVAILVVMEGVSAFLHALRLHWVEFQSKFYVGGGELFQPLTFQHAFVAKD